MSLKDVLNRFALVSSLEQQEISKWIFVVVDCIKYFESRVNTDSLSELDKRRLSHACAVYAYYKYSLMNYASGVQRFKAGDVEITTAESMSDNAHKMWQNEKKEIADIFDFDDFHFCRVRT